MTEITKLEELKSKIFLDKENIYIPRSFLAEIDNDKLALSLFVEAIKQKNAESSD